jgi:two-component system sensor histidine kinase VanS
VNKKNFSVKIFIGITFIILAVGLFVFAILRIFIPKIYENELRTRVNVDAGNFINVLNNTPSEEWFNTLSQFCSSNNMNATVYRADGSQRYIIGLSFSALHDYKETHKSFDISTLFRLYKANMDDYRYTIIFYYNPQSVEQVTDTFDTVLPVLLVVIFLISLFIAFFYTRFLVSIKNLQNEIEEERRHRNFFSALSHELKTPVTILKGELDGMILGVGKFKDRDKYLGEAYKTTESIERLVKEIMTAAKLDTVKISPEEISLSELTDECITNIDELIKEKNIKVNQKFFDTSIVADKKLIAIVISNIIGNAVKHSPQNTEIDIVFDETAKLSVENHGTHISENLSDTDLSGGLGLYIVKSILDMHGLKYNFENTDDGTLFSINFTKM